MSLTTKAHRAIHGDRFQRWIERRERYVYGCVKAGSAERWILRQCQIERLSDLDNNEQAGQRFRELCDEFVAEIAACEDQT